MKKKVLIITYYWPPSGGSGVQRWLYFSKYLVDFGYTPIVLTVSEKSASYKNLDYGLLKKVKHIKTYKTKTFELLKLYSLITTGNTRKGIPQGHIGNKKKSFFKQMSSFIRGNLFIPDARKGWNLFAIRQAESIINTENIPLIITTGPPHSTHLIGKKLNDKLGVKWVADFRDPWSELYYNKDLMRTQHTIKKDITLEVGVLNQADLILTIGIKMKELLLKRITFNKEKIHHIYNGFDSHLMRSIKNVEHSNFEISFIGVLSHNQPFESIIKALKLFITNNNTNKIILNLAGTIQNTILSSFKHELPEIDIRHFGYVSHEKSIQLMKRSQLLLNCLAEMKQSQILISGKQMEYVATGNPIIVFGDTQGESALLLKEIPNAKTFAKNDFLPASMFIQLVYDKWKEKKPFINQVENESILNKSRYETTRQLSLLLNKFYNV